MLARKYNARKGVDDPDRPISSKITRNLLRSLPKGEKLSPLSQTAEVWDFPHPEAQKVIKSLKDLDNPNLLFWNIPKLQDTSFEREILRLKETLIFYDKFIKDKRNSPIGILRENLARGPAFAEELDDSLQYSLRLSAAMFLSYGINDLPSTIQEIESYDSIFPACHLLPFKKKESDYSFMMEKSPIISEQNLKLFREKVIELANIGISYKPEFDDLMRLKLSGTSTNLDPLDRKRYQKTFLNVKHGKEVKSPEKWLFDTCLVYKAPHESRSCVVPTQGTLRDMMLLEKQLEVVLNNVPSNKFYEKDFSFLEEYMTTYSHSVYIMSDQKKCGMTFPLELLKELFKVLEELFPNLDFNLFRKISDAEYNIPGIGWTKVNRGVGLGMFNGAISIATAIVFEIWKDNQIRKEFIDGLFYNDDQLIRIRNAADLRAEPEFRSDLIELALDWDKHMEAFGMQVHKKKPFTAMAGVFLEEYGEGFPVSTEKRVQLIGNLFYALTCVNITHAKELVRSVMNSLPPGLESEISYVMSRIVMFWGFEFGPRELTLPYELGGWYDKLNSFNENLLLKELVDLERRDLRYLSVYFTPPRGEKSKMYYSTKLKQLDKIRKKIVDQCPRYSKFVGEYDWHTLFTSSLKDPDRTSKGNLSYYTQWYNDRQKAFKKKPFLRKYKSLIQYSLFQGHLNSGKFVIPEILKDHFEPVSLERNKDEDSLFKREDSGSLKLYLKVCQTIGWYQDFNFSNIPHDNGCKYAYMYDMCKSLLGRDQAPMKILNFLLYFPSVNIEKICMSTLIHLGYYGIPKWREVHPIIYHWFGLKSLDDETIILDSERRFPLWLPTSFSSYDIKDLIRRAWQHFFDYFEDVPDLSFQQIVGKDKSTVRYPYVYGLRQDLGIRPKRPDQEYESKEQQELIDSFGIDWKQYFSDISISHSSDHFGTIGDDPDQPHIEVEEDVTSQWLSNNHEENNEGASSDEEESSLGLFDF